MWTWIPMALAGPCEAPIGVEDLAPPARTAASVVDLRPRVFPLRNPLSGVRGEPDESTPAPVPRDPAPASPPLPTTPRTSRTLTAIGLLTAAGGSGALALAASTRNAYRSTPVSADASDLRTRNRVAGYGGYALSGIGLGLVTSAVIVGKW